jgi:hypothetical protein
MITVGVTGAFAHAEKRDRRAPKNMGTLTVRTTPASYPVKVDGQYVGMSGISDAVEFYLTPGIHMIEVGGPNGSVYTREIDIRRQTKHCICLKLVEETISNPCPYRFHLEGPDSVQAGEVIRFSAINDGTAPIPLRYQWRISGGRITSGLNSPAITVDTSNMGGQTIEAELDVNDDTYDNRCRQVISVPTDIIPPPPPINPPSKVQCDQFDARSADDDKARFDNCAIMVQNTPDAQLYVIIHPGTDRRSRTVNTYERLSRRTLDYLVKERGVDPRRIQILKGSPQTSTSYEIWVVPPGADPPVVQ